MIVCYNPDYTILRMHWLSLLGDKETIAWSDEVRTPRLAELSIYILVI